MFFYNTSIMVLAKKLLFFLISLQEDRSLIKPLVRGKLSFTKSLKTDEFPKEEVEPSPEPEEEACATELEIPIDPSHDLVAKNLLIRELKTN